MKKITIVALIAFISIICVGCGKNESENNNNEKNEIVQNTVVSDDKNNYLQNELENLENNYVEGITEPVRIEESEDELRVNVKGNVTSIYKCSGDFVTDWYEKYYFKDNESAQSFANEQENQSNVSTKENVVVLKIEIPNGTVMKKSDLIKTYSGLKEVYENEQ